MSQFSGAPNTRTRFEIARHGLEIGEANTTVPLGVHYEHTRLTTRWHLDRVLLKESSV